MSASNRSFRTLIQGLSALLAVAVTVPAVTLSVASAQYIGPMPPQPRPTQQGPATKAIMKLFKKSDPAVKSGADQEAGAEAQADGKEDASRAAGAEKPRVKAPEHTEPPKRPPMLTQPTLDNAKVEEPQVDSENPPDLSHPKLDDPTNPLGLTDAENRLKRLITQLDAQRFGETRPGLVQLRQYLVDITEAHIGLYKTLNQIPSARAQAELEKTLALQFAQLRDRSMLEMARVYIAEKDYPRAVKELTEVVKSQPKSKLGLRSYELLQEIGFTEKLQLAQ